MRDGTTRDQIVAAADDLFFRQGFAHTSFADIAAAVSISRGNFYHHFKAKDDILEAVIERRLAKTRAMLEGWEKEGGTPAARIRLYIEIVIRNRDSVMSHGCPVGTLTAELAKLDHGCQEAASRIFGLFRDWLSRQFAELGRPDEADDLAMHILAMSQGVSILANALHDDAFIRREVERMYAVVDAAARGAD